MTVRFIRAGYCVHPKSAALRGAPWRPIQFPATVAVIAHPRHGVVLFDTGYSEHFFWATRRLPERAYRVITPVFLDEGVTARAQLERLGIATADVRTIVLSHFHADHVAGARDFPKARFIYHAESYDRVKDLGRWSALRRAFLPSLLPADFVARSRPIFDFRASVDLPHFAGGHDLFDDGSIRLVPMPGHAFGHLGLFVRTSAQDYLLSGDACYVRENFEADRPCGTLARAIIDDYSEYRRTLTRLHHFSLAQPGVKIVPCHCAATFADVGGSPGV